MDSVLLDKFIDEFDVNSIPMPVLDSAWLDYEPFFDYLDLWKVDENGVYDEHLYESSDVEENISARSVREVVEMMSSPRGIFLKQCHNGVEFIEPDRLLEENPGFLAMNLLMVIPDIKDNVGLITKKFSDFGYYVSHKYIKSDKKGRQWILITCEPKEQKSITHQVLKNHTYAYCSVPIHEVGAIERTGITANIGVPPFNSDKKRVYLYIGDPKDAKYKRMMTAISDSIKSRQKHFAGDFVEYEIRLDKLPKDMEFKIDENVYGSNFVYVERDIPLEAIRDRQHKTFCETGADRARKKI